MRSNAIDMILEIEDIVEARSFDAATSAREMLASLSPELLDELASKVAQILLQRVEHHRISEIGLRHLEDALRTTTRHASPPSRRRRTTLTKVARIPMISRWLNPRAVHLS